MGGCVAESRHHRAPNNDREDTPMSTPEKNCRLCFPHGDQPQCRTFETSVGAIRIFSTLFADNRMPMMCQSSDRHYRVCSQSAVTMATPLPGGRISEKTERAA